MDISYKSHQWFSTYRQCCVTAGFCREVAENCTLLGYCTVSSGSVYHYTLCNNPEERISCYHRYFIFLWSL